MSDIARIKNKNNKKRISNQSVQTTQSLLWGQAPTERHTSAECDGNEKLRWNLDKSAIINPEAETKGEFSE